MNARIVQPPFIAVEERSVLVKQEGMERDNERDNWWWERWWEWETGYL